MLVFFAAASPTSSQSRYYTQWILSCWILCVYFIVWLFSLRSSANGACVCCYFECFHVSHPVCYYRRRRRQLHCFYSLVHLLVRMFHQHRHILYTPRVTADILTPPQAQRTCMHHICLADQSFIFFVIIDINWFRYSNAIHLFHGFSVCFPFLLFLLLCVALFSLAFALSVRACHACIARILPDCVI